MPKAQRLKRGLQARVAFAPINGCVQETFTAFRGAPIGGSVPPGCRRAPVRAPRSLVIDAPPPDREHSAPARARRGTPAENKDNLSGCSRCFRRERPPGPSVSYDEEDKGRFVDFAKPPTQGEGEAAVARVWVSLT